MIHAEVVSAYSHCPRKAFLLHCTEDRGTHHSSTTGNILAHGAIQGWVAQTVNESSCRALSSPFEDCQPRSRRQPESQTIEVFELGIDPGNPAFHFCAQ